MPTKPQRPCSWPGCPKLTAGRYCKTHAPRAAAQYEARRDPNVRRRYGRRWRETRDAYAAAHPLCERCLAEGKAVPMDEVHHKVPVALGGSHDWSNLQSLCRSCHQKADIELGMRHPGA